MVLYFRLRGMIMLVYYIKIGTPRPSSFLSEDLFLLPCAFEPLKKWAEWTRGIWSLDHSSLPTPSIKKNLRHHSQ